MELLIYFITRFFACLALALVTATTYAQTLTIAQTDSGVWVYERGEKVLFYQAATKSKEGAYPRANYVHPLYGLDGAVLTEDFPEDHLHHRGVFWAWHQVMIGKKAMGDAWECRDFVWEVDSPQHERGEEEELTLHMTVYWKSPAWQDASGRESAFLEEKTRISIYPTVKNYRIIDFEISLLALVPKLKIGGADNAKGYGGFSLRIKTPEDLSFSSPSGELIPKEGPVKAGPWVNMAGSLLADGGKGGIILIPHPRNPGYPERWILRKKESMQNVVYPGRRPVRISKTRPTVLKYRLVLYRGDQSAYPAE